MTHRALRTLTDNQGTVRDVIDNSTGTTVAGGHFKYDAYGQILEGDKELTRYLYTGRDFDATTGLQYNRARWYDSFTGRWTTQDPIGLILPLRATMSGRQGHSRFSTGGWAGASA